MQRLGSRLIGPLPHTPLAVHTALPTGAVILGAERVGNDVIRIHYLYEDGVANSDYIVEFVTGTEKIGDITPGYERKCRALLPGRRHEDPLLFVFEWVRVPSADMIMENGRG